MEDVQMENGLDYPQFSKWLSRQLVMHQLTAVAFAFFREHFTENQYDLARPVLFYVVCTVIKVF